MRHFWKNQLPKLESGSSLRTKRGCFNDKLPVRLTAPLDLREAQRPTYEGTGTAKPEPEPQLRLPL